MPFDNHDIITDILQRIAQQTNASAKSLAGVEKAIRADWGGERCYIAKVGEDARAQLAERDRQIRKEFRYGEHEALLARRWEISVRRVRQIVQADPEAGNALP